MPSRPAQPAIVSGALAALLAVPLALAGCSDDSNQSGDVGDSGVDGDAGADSDAGPQAICDPDLLLHVPSPDWRDQVVYFVFTDRFDDGDSSNNDQGAGEFDPASEHHYSGGDLQGIIDRLDYIQGLGVTALWITPPVANQWWDPWVAVSGYHGYWGRDFTSVDEHLGTYETYCQLSHELHSRGMYLIQDIVPNHTGNFFRYTDNDWNPDDVTESFEINTESRPTSAPIQPPFDRNDANNPEDLAAAIFHWTPNISDFQDPVQEWTYQLSGLDDINTENPEVRDVLRESYGFWIREIGVDGFRVDTVKFVAHEFWNDFFHGTDPDSPGINAQAAATGRDSFLSFGEVFEIADVLDEEGDLVRTAEEKIASYLGTAEAPELMSLLQFPLHAELTEMFTGNQPTRAMTARLERWMDEEVFPNPHLMPTFIDNHDTSRFLAGGSVESLELALTMLMTLPGIPIIYYGTEQELEVTRAAMFEGGFQSGGSDHFDTAAPLYGLIQDLIAVRAADPLWSRGDLEVVQDAPAGLGLFVYRRAHEGGEGLVIINNADEPILANIATELANTPRLEVAQRLRAQGRPKVDANGRILMEMNPRSAFVLSVTDESDAAPTPGAIITVATAIDGEVFDEDIVITGTIDPVAPLVAVLDDYLDRALPVTVEDDGTWEVLIGLDHFPSDAVTDHTLTFYNAFHGAATPRYELTTDVVFRGVVETIDDPVGDDTGPEGTYTYPAGDGTFHDADTGAPLHTGDITRMVVKADARTLIIELTMNGYSTVWNPNNGFDHVSFNTYFDFPDEDGLTFLPRINGTAPADFDWDRSNFAFGWSNFMFTSDGADEATWGGSSGGAPELTSNASTKTIAFRYDREAFDIDTWEGVQVYVTTWDFDGIGNLYRSVSTSDPADSPWTYYGGDGWEGRIRSCTEDADCQSINDALCCTPDDPDDPSACTETFCSCGEAGLCLLDSDDSPVHTDPLILDDVGPFTIPEIVTDGR